MKNNSTKERDHDMIVLLHHVRDMTYKAREKELNKYGITPTQSAILDTIKLFEVNKVEVTIDKLARHLFRAHHTISTILTRMENDGLIRKVSGGGKRRRIDIVLTEKGEEAYLHSLKRESYLEVASCLSVEERKQLVAFLEKLLDKTIRYIGDSENDLPLKKEIIY